MNERPFILTIIATLLLVSSAGLLFDLLAVADIEHWPISRVLAAALHCAVTGLCGVGILKGWPWARVLWAYGFTLVGAMLTAGLGLTMWALVAAAHPAKVPAARVETSQSFSVAP